MRNAHPVRRQLPWTTVCHRDIKKIAINKWIDELQRCISWQFVQEHGYGPVESSLRNYMQESSVQRTSHRWKRLCSPGSPRPKPINMSGENMSCSLWELHTWEEEGKQVSQKIDMQMEKKKIRRPYSFCGKTSKSPNAIARIKGESGERGEISSADKQQDRRPLTKTT